MEKSITTYNSTNVHTSHDLVKPILLDPDSQKYRHSLLVGSIPTAMFADKLRDMIAESTSNPFKKQHYCNN